MPIITHADYEVGEKIWESNDSLVCRGVSKKSDEPVIVKMLREENPSPQRHMRFVREYGILKDLLLQGVVKALDLFVDQHRPVMVLEDFKGQSLADLSRKKRFGTLDLLRIGIKIAETLDQLYRHGIIHKDINPANIIYNPDSDVLKLIDFGNATLIPREMQSADNPAALEGTLAYMAPEQTGRMNRSVDYRTDFYSLGVTLYELATGDLPFSAADPVEMVYCHIAKQCTPPADRDRSVDRILSDIIMKLMAKNAEERYQSALGLKHDLQTRLDQIQCGEKTATLTIGVRDVSDRLHFPSKLYGRENELRELAAVWNRMLSGTAACVIVSGGAGIGKSTLVQEIQKSTAEGNGFFIRGKFDQFKSEIPYSSILQAFQSLIRRILTEPEATIKEWRAKLTDSLGINAKVLSAVIPELELVMGTLKEIPTLPPLEAKNRFQLAFENFVGIFSSPEYPLALFIDDLQWADAESLNMIKNLLAHSEHERLLIIGAFRDNEVNPGHPLLATIEEIKRTGIPFTSINLRPLQLPDVESYCGDLLQCSAQRCGGLSELIYKKTDGNPLFLQEFIQSLEYQGLLVFNRDLLQWQWDLQKITQSTLTESIVSLLNHKVRRLTAEAQKILEIASCIGNRFDLRTLFILAETSSTAAAKALQEALEYGVITPMDSSYKVMNLDMKGIADEAAAEYAFAHDRVRQAMYGLLDDEKKRQAHWRIGSILLKELPEEAKQRRIIEIVNHLNAGAAGSVDEKQHRELASLNYRAGQKARGDAAYHAAFTFFKAGLALLGKIAWIEQYDLALSLHAAGAEAASLNGDFILMDRYTDVMLTNAQNDLDKVTAYEIRMQAAIARNEPREAVCIGRQALGLLGIQIPQNAGMVRVIAGMGKIRFLLGGKKPEKIVSMPPMGNPTALRAMRVLSTLAAAVYMAYPNLYSVVIFKMIELSLRHGNALQTPIAYAAYGLVLCGALGDIESGYSYGKLATDLLKKLTARESSASVNYLNSILIKHWKEPLRDIVHILPYVYRDCLNAGDFLFASVAAELVSCYLFYTGHNLAVVEQKHQELSKEIEKLNQPWIADGHSMVHQAFLNLLGKNQDAPFQLEGEKFNEGKTIAGYLKKNDSMNLSCFYFLKLQLNLIFRNLEEAYSYSQKIIPHMGMYFSQPEFAICHFYRGLAHAGVLGAGHAKNAKAARKDFAKSLQKMKKWARYCPHNYLQKHYLMQAEWARICHKDDEARTLYDKAIDAAREHRYVNEEALANELAARYYFSRSRVRVGTHYLRDAHYAYVKWGATAKVECLEKEFPQFLASVAQSARQASSSPSPSGSATLDLSSGIKAAQAISREIKIDSLLTTLMKVIMENGGAQRGVLVLKKEDEWVIEARGRNEGDVQVLEHLPLDLERDGVPLLPLKVINFVLRTGEDLILSDVSSSAEFTNDSYFAAHTVKSALCTALVNQGALNGVVYLENNLLTDAFTQDRVQILQLLSGQAAISLQNANYHENQMAALQARINPHFLFNALNSIADLAANEPQRAETAIVKLSTLYRYILTSSERNLVSLSQEVEIVRSYLMLEKLRYGDKLSFTVETTGAIERVRIPGLVIQPLVENAIHHGISPKIDGGIVKVTIEAENGLCRIVVKDNGAGWNDGLKKTKGTGFGIRSVQERLRIIFGGDFVFNIHKHEGVAVEIFFKIRR